jgi:hypothetical protein
MEGVIQVGLPGQPGSPPEPKIETKEPEVPMPELIIDPKIELELRL